MKEIIVKFKPFVLNQTVFIKENDKIIERKMSQKDLPDFIAKANDIDSVHFFGSQRYVEKIKDECLSRFIVYNNTNLVKILINE